jgi:hypothetical protein
LEPDDSLVRLRHLHRDGQPRKRQGLVRIGQQVRPVVAQPGDGALLPGERLGREHLLRIGGVIKWQPDGATEARYIDFEPSPAPALLNGREVELLQVVRQFDTPKGVDLTIWRQPYLRSAAIDSLLNFLDNADLLTDHNLDGRPSAWAWASATNITNEAIDSAEAAYRFDIATAAQRTLQQTTAVGTAVQNDVWTLSFYAKQAGVATTCKAQVILEYLDAASVVQTTHTGTAISLGQTWQRITVTATATDADTSRMRVNLVMDNDDANSYTVYWRFAQLEEASAVTRFRQADQTVNNDPAIINGRTLSVYGHGDAETIMPLRIKGEAAGTKLQSIIVGALSDDGVDGRRRLTDYLNGTKFAQCEATGTGWTVTLAGDTAQTADADASGGSMARCSYTTNPTVMARRVRISRTTKLDSLRGTWDVYARAKATAASKHTIQLRWVPSLADPAAHTEPEVPVDKTGFTAFQYEDIPVARIHIPESTPIPLGGLALELWARRDSGTGNMDWDFIFFMPVNDRLTQIYVPGSSSEQWLGKDLVTPTNPAGLTAGTVEGTYLALDANQDAGGTPPVAGLDWPDGRNRVTYVVSNSGLGSADVIFRIRNVTDSANTVTETLTLATREVRTVVHEFDAVASKLYQPQVILNTTGDKVWIRSIDHSFIPAIGLNEQAYTDPDLGAVSKYDSVGNILQDLALKGALPMRLPPGLTVLVFVFADVPQPLHTYGESIITRAPVVVTTQTPRWFG